MYQGPGVYRHYKGALYYALGLAKHSETDEALVVYVPLYMSESQFQLTARPLRMWNEDLPAPEQLKDSQGLPHRIARFRLMRADDGKLPFEAYPNYQVEAKEIRRCRHGHAKPHLCDLCLSGVD